MILDDDKEYDHQETKTLLEEVRNFVQKDLKIIVPECTLQKKDVKEGKNGGVIEIFYIEKCVEPLYADCNKYGDLEGILDLFDFRLNELLDSIDAILDNNGELDDDSKDNIESYASVIDKCVTVYTNQRRKRATKFKELLTVDELQVELRQLFAEIISNYIIMVLFDALYERIKNNAGQVYELIVQEINSFLAENGVYTKKVSVGDQLEPECMEPTSDSVDNVTDDFQLFDKIDEIRRYPYFFADDTKIIDGCARIWRRRD